MSNFENDNSNVPNPTDEVIENKIVGHSVNEQSNLQNELQQPTKIVEQFEQKTAGFWMRFWAFIIDVLIVSAIVGILVNPIFNLFDWSLSDSSWYAPITIISAIFYYAYFVLMTKYLQQTVGKMIFGLKVQTVNGEKLSWGTVLFREWIGRFINNTIPILYVIVAIMPKNMSVADYIADTVVVHESVFVKDKKILKEDSAIA